MKMRLKFLCLLWCVSSHFGLASDIDIEMIEAKNLEVLRKLPKNIPEEDRLAITLWLGELKGRIRFGAVEKDKLAEEKDKLLIKYANIELQYGSVVQAVKSRDWIIDKEREHFPEWLNYLDIGRYVKWVIALYTVDGHYINELRNELDMEEIKYEVFAAEIHRMYEISSSFVHKVIDISKPKDTYKIRQFCAHFVPRLSPSTLFACEFVVKDSYSENSDLVGEVTPKLGVTSVASTLFSKTTQNYATTFFIVITGVDIKGNIEELREEINSDIEQVLEFSTEKGIIIQSISLPGNPYKLDDDDELFEKLLPGFFLNLGVQTVLKIVTDKEIIAQYTKYEEIKSAILRKLKLRKELDKADIRFVDQD